MFLDVYPNRACYRPHEIVQIVVEARSPVDLEVRIVASISRLGDLVTRLSQVVHLVAGHKGSFRLEWMPPAGVVGGYGVDLQVLGVSGELLATASTAFDVLERWTQAPRYGFVTDFDPSRVDIETTACWLAKHHINGLQFYDWMYRHEDLLPSSEIFLDPMGRRLSLVTVKRLVDAVHARGIAALPYAAVYAASPAFFRRHPDWALLDGESRPILFGDDFLVIMNPAAGSPWTAHMMAQFDRILQEIAFDGVHLDQYGDPRSGYDARGEPVDLAHAFPAFIDATREVVRRRRGCTGAVVFNAVANWPVEAVAPAGEDVVYVEVWPEYTDEYATYRDLHRVVVEGGRAGGGKPVVLAAYVDPARERNVLLSDAVVFASGGFRIELGERGRMLADPYFPKHGRMGNGLIDRVRSYYDFAVRYESVLSLGTRDATEESAGSLAVEGTGPSAGEPCPGVWPIVRSGAGFEAISLVNLPLAGGARWDTPHDGWPEPLTDLCVRCSAGRRVARAWWASPDGGCCRAQPLDLAAGSNGEEIVLPVPRLDCWTLIVLEWAET